MGCWLRGDVCSDSGRRAVFAGYSEHGTGLSRSGHGQYGLFKRGVPITLRYYWVDESLWRERNELVGLARQAVREARREQRLKAGDHGRLKALPNIDVNMERLLWRAGIRNAYDLRLQGAKRSYLSLLQQQTNLGLRVLLSLGGAIAGYHQAALPAELHNELVRWFDHMMAMRRHGHEPVIQGRRAGPE